MLDALEVDAIWSTRKMLIGKNCSSSRTWLTAALLAVSAHCG
jgi:hypothetical protein